jgi:hypothetical protein
MNAQTLLKRVAESIKAHCGGAAAPYSAIIAAAEKDR